jgi:hypothetical protein
MEASMKDKKYEKATATTQGPHDQQKPTGGSPGTTGHTPGQSGQTPGQSGQTPGKGGVNPGRSGTTPGQSGQTPGKSGMNPGQGGGEATDSQWRPKDKQPRMPHQTGEAQKPNAG